MNDEGLESLPRPARGKGRNIDYTRIAAKCREKPMNWFQVPRKFETKNQCSNFTSGVRRGEYADFRPSEEWEAAQRSGVVYVRYVGSNR